MSSFSVAQAFNHWYGALIMAILAVMSIYLMSLIIVRYIFFRKISVDATKVLEETNKAVMANDTEKLSKLKGQRAGDPPVRVLISVGLSNSHLQGQELNQLFHITRVRQRDRLTKGLSVFGTFAAIAPFLGLLGTVLGIVDAFNSLATTGAAGPNVVATGVAEALWATAAGLVVAIPAVIANNIFRRKSNAALTEMEIVGQELILLFKMEKPGKRAAA
jgi:biopolymer transport protein ExbB/TolQ